MRRILKKLIFIWGSIVAITLTAAAHPVHVSMCNVEIEDESITVAVKLFKDDFQLAIEHNFGQYIKYEEAELLKHKNIIDQYMNNALKVVLNKRDSLRFMYSDYQVSEDAIWFYYRFEAVKPRTIDFVNQLLLDIYADQTNLMILSYQGNQKGYRFNIRNTEERIKLK